MSLMPSSTRRSKGHGRPASNAHAPAPVPPVIPLLVAHIANDGHMTVTVDGRPHEPEAFAPAWMRHNLVSLVNGLIKERNTPVRVVIQESDGSTFDDIVAEPIEAEVPLVFASTVLTDAPPQTALDDDASQAKADDAAGFLGGEEVAVAIIVRHVRAQADGSVDVSADTCPAITSEGEEVLLFGRTSATCAVRKLP